jgi:hypothetical protein
MRIISQKHKQRELLVSQIAEQNKLKKAEKWSNIEVGREVLLKDKSEVKIFENDKNQRKQQKHQLYQVLKLNYDNFLQSQKSNKISKIEEDKKYLQDYETLMAEKDQLKQREVSKWKGIQDAKVTLDLKHNGQV